MIASSVIKTELITQHFIIRGGKSIRGSLIAGHFFSCFIVFWRAVCDDEAVLVVASVGADTYHPGSHGFSQMELLLAVCGLRHSEVGSTTPR